MVSSHDTFEDKNGKPVGRLNKEKFKGKRKHINKVDEQCTSALGGRSLARSSAENDPSWYASDPQLLVDAFSISTAEKLGLPIYDDVPIISAQSSPFIEPVNNYSLPGIYSINMVPVPGISSNASSALNVAAARLYTQVRKGNSGATNYEAPDLMLYLLAMDNAFILWSWLVRLYGILSVYSSRNAYIPQGLLKSMCVSTDIIKDACQLRTLINQMRSKLLTLSVPAGLSYFTRHAWLFQNIWLDANDQKAQIYVYNPECVFKWVEQTSLGTPAYLEPVSMRPHADPFTLSSISTLIDTILNPLFYSQDFAVMSGDIRKAFGEENCLDVPSIQEDYVIVPVYNSEVLTQIENSNWTASAIPFQTPSEMESWRITQQITGSGDLQVVSLKFQPETLTNKSNFTTGRLYNFHTDVVDPAMMAVASRLNLVMDPATYSSVGQGSSSGRSKILSCGSEIVTTNEIYVWMAHLNSYQYVDIEPCYYTNSNNAFSVADIQRISLSTQFDWAPMIKLVKKSDNSLVGYTVDFDNFTRINNSTLISMNDVALLSMFGIPSGN